MADPFWDVPALRKQGKKSGGLTAHPFVDRPFQGVTTGDLGVAVKQRTTMQHGIFNAAVGHPATGPDVVIINLATLSELGDPATRPYLYNQWRDLYENYRVLRARYNIKFVLTSIPVSDVPVPDTEHHGAIFGVRVIPPDEGITEVSKGQHLYHYCDVADYPSFNPDTGDISCEFAGEWEAASAYDRADEAAYVQPFTGPFPSGPEWRLRVYASGVHYPSETHNQYEFAIIGTVEYEVEMMGPIRPGSS